MAHTITFDTLAFVKELESAGIASEQAEGQARALTKALNQVEEARLEELATKRDIKELEVKIAEIKTETIKWVAGLLLVQSGLVIGAMFAMFRLFMPN